MHILIGLAIAVALLYFLRNWRAERRRLAAHQRHLQMLYPQSTPEQVRQYVNDVYGRR